MPRQGFTLLEMILVMLLIVAAASLAVPLFDSLMNPNQVSAATDAVRVTLEQTRARAMEEGRPYRYSIVEGGGKFRIEPDDADTNPEPGFPIDGQLPEPCFFVGPGTGVIDPGATAADGALKSMVVFLPDGTTREDSEVSFGRPGLMRVTLQVRALTGSVNMVNAQAKDGSR